MPVDEARRVLDGLGVEWEDDWGSGKLMKEVVDEKIQHDIVEPIFCVDYPQEVSPLARVHRSRPGYVERFELMVAGFELCNAYSEQNDPVAQLAAFEEEARAKAEGDPEAGDIDLDYVRALEYGLPCTGGLGIGIDRLVMLLSGAREHPRGDPVPDHAARGGHPARPGRARPKGAGLGRLARRNLAPASWRPPGRSGRRHLGRRRLRRSTAARRRAPCDGATRVVAPRSHALARAPHAAHARRARRPRRADHAADAHSRSSTAARSRSATRSARPGSGSPATWSPCSSG